MKNESTFGVMPLPRQVTLSFIVQGGLSLQGNWYSKRKRERERGGGGFLAPSVGVVNSVSRDLQLY
jgi:hypothetical protein